MPACPTGGDCTPPTVSLNSANIHFEEPLYKWIEVCPVSTGTGSCWEVHVNAHLKLNASDLSGIKEIGVNLATELNARREFKKYWVSARRGNQPDVFQGSLRISTYAPPDRQLELSVYELCAKDMRNNEACIFPLEPADVK